MKQTSPPQSTIQRLEPGADRADFLAREWLLTNGIGGYASGTLGGRVERRYHGLLVAALPAPFGRVVMFNQLAEQLEIDHRTFELSSPAGDAPALTAVEFENGLPLWIHRGEGFEIERRIHMVSGQNTVHVSYTLRSPASARLVLDGSFHFRLHESDVAMGSADSYRLLAAGRDIEIQGPPSLPAVKIAVHGGDFELRYHGGETRDVLYTVEQSRGYGAEGRLWSPGRMVIGLRQNETVTLVASTERWSTIRALDPAVAREAEESRRRHLLARADVDPSDAFAARLVLAADQFLIEPAGRAEDSIRAHAVGHRVRTVIAGYHWFTDWGRDTMISLEGLALATGRAAEAGWILRLFARHVRDGLIPNLFPEGNIAGLYHTADATLWFFHAIDRYVTSTGDSDFLDQVLPLLCEIVQSHIAGTRFGIRVDPDDNLLRQGEEGYQLTWMDAKVDGWVVTPRRGKAVEINALWYNALRLLSRWVDEAGAHDVASDLRNRAEAAQRSFNFRFWNPESGCLFDVVDQPGGGNDPACRPNQLLAISLSNPVLERGHWEAVLTKVEQDLLTPVGLRSLAPGHHDYKPRYFGDLRTRDAAYHQGTVWGWLIGPFIDALVKTRPGSESRAREILEGFAPHLDEAGVNSISEIFDAEPPFTPRGCIAQAWSVAEVLRCWKMLANNS